MGEDKYAYELERFGKRIKKLRLDRNLRQLDLEVETGIDRTDISKIENGLKNIEFFTMVRLSYAMDVTLEELFNTPLSDED
ncbi:hypothetical protein GCM10027566_37700 [Arachidicoccus ginsenosidivorans]|jgi:transcriptional regulator with XRE-family HTH domain|uniref:Helix-turn-helix transcriptional regulator n=1 Tax=Arachidicoccus ginsenosidivorans TaxID=496057 RepID=A0A5B8VMI2_9BACT|nr:helix-turn-helix transcriptional regulator [Arachidicoccus ginsenosidivorans]QEC72301.1 helix-turn-helix transcriptional regulator [Arachidicoccus ginsenosidivorans]